MFQKSLVLLVQTVATCFRLATHARYLLGRTALQAKHSLLPVIPGLQPGGITHGIAFQAKILLLQCALHRLLRPHCVFFEGAYSKTCAKMHTQRQTAEKYK